MPESRTDDTRLAGPRCRGGAIAILGLVLLGTDAPLAATPAPPAAAPATTKPEGEGAPAATAARPRVVVRASRFREVMGHVELEDDEVLVVRRLDGELESFAKNRVARIVRLVEPAPGQRGRVFLRNGQSRGGVIVADDFDAVILAINGVHSRFKRDVVDFVELEESFEARYRHLRSMITADSEQRHLDLCRWLVEQRRYQLADRELRDLLSRHDLVAARRLRTLVDAQLALQRDARQDDPPAGEDDPDGDARARRDRMPVHERLLSDAEVNIIRVYEIDFEHPPKVEVPRTAIRALIDGYSSSTLMPATEDERLRLYKAEPLAVVRLLFELRARELYPQVQVLTEPLALNLFRQHVHNAWLMNNCATSRCHGGPDAGRLFLQRRDFRDARVRYTNLLTLERLQVDPKLRLVDYEQPLDSLIIQYGLPRDRARRPHPPARGWRAAFRHTDGRAVQDTVAWMKAVLRPRTAYPVDFDPNPPPPPPPPPGQEREPGGVSR